MVNRRALLKLLGLLPFAPLLRLLRLASAAAAPVRVKQYASYVIRNLRTLEVLDRSTVVPAHIIYGGSVEIPGMAVPAAQQWIKRQRRREVAWAAELYRDGAP